MTSSSSSAAHVLYLTNTNDPVPLTHAYHATASRTLSTSLPGTTSASASTHTDVDSAYCVQCLYSWDVSTAFSTAKGRCWKPTGSSGGASQSGNECCVGCVSCPMCSAVLSFSVVSKDSWTCPNGGDTEENFTHVCVYKCGYCHWESSESDLYQTFDVSTPSNDDADATSTDTDTTNSKDKMKIATMQLRQKLSHMLRTKDEDEQDEEGSYFHQMTKAWKTKVEITEKNKRRMELIHGVSGGDSSSGASASATSSSRTGGMIANTIYETRDEKKEDRGTTTWSVEALEDAMKRRKEMMAQTIAETLSVPKHTQKYLTMGDEITLDDSDGNDEERKYPSQTLHDPLQIARQQVISSSNNYVQQQQQPLPVPLALRPRLVRRCVEEMKAGRPGILIKPKVNPLEGDTSLRYGHGQWWKKVCVLILTFHI